VCRSAETAALEEIKRDLFLFMESSSTRVSCHQAVQMVARKNGGQTRQATLLINHLVAAGFFRYVYDCGQSFLEKNYTGIVRLSDRVIISPPSYEALKQTGMFTVRVMPGAAFGDCRHPTTRLSVKAVDFALTDESLLPSAEKALDIGTGSGILAITAAILGINRVLAIDIDPCARKEARENVLENQLQDRITVSDRSVDNITEQFNLIIGNLRPPTLIRYAEQISEKTTKNGLVILSGMKEDEYDTIMAVYLKRFNSIWKAAEDGWCATVLQKKRGKHGD